MANTVWKEDLPSWANPAPNAKVPTNLITWFSHTYPGEDWHKLSSKSKDKYRTEYNDWIESMKASTGGITEEEGAVSEEIVPTEEPTPALPTTPMPTFGEGLGAKIPTPEVTPAPAYEPTPEQLAWQEEYGGKLSEWLEAGGYGIPEETQQQIIQQQTDVLKAREKESIRVMRNNMERRGITNSGFVYANEQAIKATTTKTLAESIRDVRIKSSLMKLESFERAMGQSAQFLGYLSEQSQLKYQPKFATWQAEQMAKLQKWQAQMDVYKMQIAQAYQQQNMGLAHQYDMELAEKQHQYDKELAQMELEASQQAAAAEGIGNIVGTLLMLPLLPFFMG